MTRMRYLPLVLVAFLFACSERGNRISTGPEFDLSGDSLPPDTVPPDTTPPDTTTPPADTVKVARIVLSPSVLRLGAGDSAAVTANLYDARGNPICCRNVGFLIGDSAVALIESSFGQFAHVRGVARGHTTITAFIEGRTDRAQVIVR